MEIKNGFVHRLDLLRFIAQNKNATFYHIYIKGGGGTLENGHQKFEKRNTIFDRIS
jgi:hypothetical protein